MPVLSRALDALLRGQESDPFKWLGAHLDHARRPQGLPPLPFGMALHLGDMLWGNIGTADRLDFTAIGWGLTSTMPGVASWSGSFARVSHRRICWCGIQETRRCR